MKVYICAMSEYDKDIRYDLTRKAEPIYKHLILLKLYPNTEWCDGWRTEICAFLNSIDRRKRNKKYPSYKFIYNALSTHLDIVSNYESQMRSKMRKSGAVAKDYPISDLISCIDNYITWLSDKLSMQGYVSDDDILDKLSSMGL